MRSLAIVNPVSGQGKAIEVWRRVRAQVDGLGGWECAMTERIGHARELAATGTYDRVIVIGGDGTVCEVADALAHSETALGLIPVGTGNDTARNLGIPSDPLAAARLAVTGDPRLIDLGEIDTGKTRRYFANIAGFGFDAEVAWRVNRMPRLMGGSLPYVVGVLRTLWQFRSPHVRISIDGQVLDGRVFMVAVANCPSYGGGMRIAPDARHDDGALDVCVVSDLSRLEVLRVVPKMYSGGHVGHPAVKLLRCQSVVAESDEPVRCHADGEQMGGLPATFRIAPKALRCVTGVP